MFERGITPEKVKRVVREGRQEADYPDERPYPSRLLLVYSGDCPIHVVVAGDKQSGICIVVTTYQSDPTLWDNDFLRKL